VAAHPTSPVVPVGGIVLGTGPTLIPWKRCGDPRRRRRRSVGRGLPLPPGCRRLQPHIGRVTEEAVFQEGVVRTFVDLGNTDSIADERATVDRTLTRTISTLQKYSVLRVVLNQGPRHRNVRDVGQENANLTVRRVHASADHHVPEVVVAAAGESNTSLGPPADTGQLDLRQRPERGVEHDGIAGAVRYPGVDQPDSMAAIEMNPGVELVQPRVFEEEAFHRNVVGATR
jgi:hypothetical protein